MSLAIALALATQAAPAQTVLPQGGTVTSGVVSIDGSTPDVLTVTSLTPSNAVDWTSFSIGPAGLVQFQQGTSHATTNTVRGSTVSLLAGRWTGQGTVTLRNDNSINLSGSYVAPGGTLSLLTAQTLGMAGQVSLHGAGGAHGGDVYLSGDRYLEVGGSIDVGADSPGNGGTVHIATQDRLQVSDTFSSHILPDGTHDIATSIPSQVRAGSLNSSGGGAALYSAKDLWVNAGLHVAGPLSLTADDGLFINSYLTADAGVGRSDLTLQSIRSINVAREMPLRTTGDLILDAPDIWVGGPISADRIVLRAGGDVSLLPASTGPGITANVLTGTAAGTITLDGTANHIAAINDLATQGNLYFITASDTVVRDIQVAKNAVFTTADHDLYVLGDGNVFGGNFGAQARDVQVKASGPLTVDWISARNIFLDVDGPVRFATLSRAFGNFEVKAAGDITADDPYGITASGVMTLDAGTHDIYLPTISNHVDGVLQMKGANITFGTMEPLKLGDVQASSGLTLTGYQDIPGYRVTVIGNVVAPSIHVAGGALQIGDWGTTGTVTGDIVLDGNLHFLRADRYAYGGNVSGAGTVSQDGYGTIALNGHIANTPGIQAIRGTTLVGDAAHPGALVDGPVQVDGTLGGTGRVVGAVTADAGATIAPGDGIGTLRVGSLTMHDRSQLVIDGGAPGASFNTPGTADSLVVDGDVVFDGRVSMWVNNTGNMGAGIYKVLSWGGTLDESAGSLQVDPLASSAFSLQRDLAGKRIDLISTLGMNLQFWNANRQAHGATRGGGSGTWSNTSANWTDRDATVTAPMFPRPGYAIFAGAPGTVTVDSSAGPVVTQGMQFAVDGYVLQGAPIAFDSEAPAAISFRVGDGSVAGKGMTATIHNALQGDGPLVKSDEGTLVLTGTNTYRGGTFITAGTLAVDSDTSLGMAGDLLALNGGTLRVDGTTFHGTQRLIWLGMDASGGGIDVSDPGNTFTINTDHMYGTGLALVKSGAGTLAVRGSQSLRGPIVVNEGTLLGDAYTLSGDITNNGTVVFDQDGWIGNRLGKTAGSGVFIKTSPGVLGFDGASSFTGTTRVEQGRLEVGGITQLVDGVTVVPGALGGNIEVASMASLSGIGVVGGNVVTDGYIRSGSTISGNLAGTLTVGGSVQFKGDSALMIGGDGRRASQLAVGGHVTIDPGARLVIDAQIAPWIADHQYDVLTAAGGITGTFGPINSNFAFLNTLIAYSESGNISLILQRNAAALEDAAVTPNQRAVAVAAGALGTGNAVYDRLIALDAPSARAAFTSLAGTLHASTQGAVLDSQRQVRDAVTRHLGDADLPGGQRADDGRVSTWFSVIGRDADYDGNADAAKVDSSDSGVLLGADLAVGDGARIGAVLGHVKQNIHERASGGSADVKGNQFGLYGDMAFEALHLSGGVIQAHHSIDTRRDITIGSDTTRAYASRDADTTQGFAELGYRVGRADAWKVEPFVQAAVVRWSGDNATERGGTGALVVEDNNAHVTTGRAGVHLGTALDREARFGLQATLAWQRAWGDVAPQARLRFAEGSAGFTTTGAPLARNAGILDAGFVVRLTPALRLDASYTGQFAGKASDHGGRLSLNMTF